MSKEGFNLGCAVVAIVLILIMVAAAIGGMSGGGMIQQYHQSAPTQVVPSDPCNGVGTVHCQNGTCLCY